MQTIHLTPHEIEKVVQFMQQASGNDCSGKDVFINSKMSALCSSAGYDHFWELWDDAQQTTIAGARLRQRVIDELTTSYSYFYREHAHFELLSKLIGSGDVPAAAQDLRVWSAGCATGEEAYNIAMAIEDARRAGALPGGYEVVGSDISSRAINAAKDARYDASNVARMPPHWRNLYCQRDEQDYRIGADLRKHVTFRLENVFAPHPAMPFDVVVCRNMLIYFNREAIERFCSLLRGRVKPGGYLFLGHTEILGQIDGFTYVMPSVWRKN